MKDFKVYKKTKYGVYEVKCLGFEEKNLINEDANEDAGEAKEKTMIKMRFETLDAKKHLIRFNLFEGDYKLDKNGEKILDEDGDPVREARSLVYFIQSICNLADEDLSAYEALQWLVDTEEPIKLTIYPAYTVKNGEEHTWTNYTVDPEFEFEM